MNIKNLYIPDWKFRHIRFVKNQRFLKLKRKLNPEKLVDFFNKNNITEAYYSISLFVNPHKIKSRKIEKPLETIYMRSDLFFDIDVSPFSLKNLSKARDLSLAVLDFIKEKGFDINYIAFSGNKGFHVSVKDPYEYEGLPIEKERAAIAYRKMLLEEIKERNLAIDYNVFLDTRRIVRIPGTFNEKTGYQCRVLDKQELFDIPKLLERTPRIKASPRKTSLFSKLLKRFSSQNQPSKGFQPFLRSNVLGTKREILIAEFQQLSFKEAETKAKLLKDVYNVSPIFFGTIKKRSYLISPMALDKPRIFKILKAIKANNLGAFKKYNHSIIPIAPNLRELFKPIISEYSEENLSKFHSKLFGLKGKIGKPKGRIFLGLIS